MAAGIHEHAAAGLLWIEPPTAHAQPVLRDVGDNAANLPQGTPTHQFPRIDEVRHPMPLIGHHQGPLAFRGQRQ